MNLNDTYDDKVILPFLRTLTKPKGVRGDVIFQAPAEPNTYFEAVDIELNYDTFIVANSGGKDSLVALKILLDKGVPASKIEIWHHLVDGRESMSSFMDWAFMDDYIVKLGAALGIKVYFSWLKHGFEGEMLKHKSISHPVLFETPLGVKQSVRRTHKIDKDAGSVTFGERIQIQNSRLHFPQQAASLATRWCSSALKIDVGNTAIRGQDRLLNQRVLFVSGERREESPNRARYNQLEAHCTDTARSQRKGDTMLVNRHVDTWRPALHYTEEMVWQLLSDWRLVAPVPYRLGWSRSSCMGCIFNDDTIFATIAHYWPDRFQSILDYELKFGVSISRSGKNIAQRTAAVKPLNITDEDAIRQASSAEYALPIFTPDSRAWELPLGAFSKSKSGAS